MRSFILLPILFSIKNHEKISQNCLNAIFEMNKYNLLLSPHVLTLARIIYSLDLKMRLLVNCRENPTGFLARHKIMELYI